MGDDKQKERISAKNSLESFIFNVESSLDQDEVKNKLTKEEIEAAKTKLETALKWLDSNQLAEKEEFVEKQNELEETTRPLMAKIYENNGQTEGQTRGQQETQSQSEPTVE